MGFNERVQAYLAMKWGRELTERFGERGRAAFVYAVRCYGEGRGRRMAQRAIRDGQPLDVRTYLRYGEWVNTEEIRAAGQANQAKILAAGETYIKQVVLCPWNLQFTEMGETELGDLYCRHIDSSIAAGFSDSFRYTVPQNLNQGRGVSCLHIVQDAGIDGPVGEKKLEYLKPFSYHCADLHYAFRSAVTAIFREEGEEAARKVEESFRQDYGDAMAEELAGFAGTDFSKS